jgi:hypothetical protein
LPSQKHIRIQLEYLDGACDIVVLQKRVTKNIQGAFAKIKGGASVVFLLEIGVVVEGRLQTLLSILLAKFYVEHHGPRPAMVAGMTPQVYAAVASAQSVEAFPVRVDNAAF